MSARNVDPRRLGSLNVDARRLNARVESWLWLIQRASAALLAACVAVHLVTMILAVRGGLTAAEILSRTQGSAALAAFYGLFVVAVAVHTPIGLRTVCTEWLSWRGRSLEFAMALLGLLLLALGWRAVAGVVS